MIGFKGIGRVVTDGMLIGHCILVDAGKIRAILPEEKVHQWLTSHGATVDHWVDLQGLDLLPGFIDIHVHGSSGADASDGTPEALDTIARSLIRTGVTGFLATTVTLEDAKVRNVLKSCKDFIDSQEYHAFDADDSESTDTPSTIETSSITGAPSRARLLGVHLEGPFLSVSHKGAHEAGLIADPEIAHMQAICDGFWDIISIVTLAPDRPGALESIKLLTDKGIIVSLGHSGCSYEVGKAAVKAGAKSITHLFNAMSGLHHRDPGLVGVAFAHDLHTELIADGIHVHPELFSVVRKVKGDDRLILITDAMRGQCMRSGTYDLGGLEVVVDGASARLTNGVLAGSVLTMDQAMRNMHEHASCDLVALARMLATNPAELVGLEDAGAITSGRRADFVALDSNMKVQRVWIEGVEQDIT